MADRVARLFDAWAGNGRAERMEREHSKTARPFLESLRLSRPFSFLDIGCGNGWAVRWAASQPGCRRAVGIDKSASMIRSARSRAAGGAESYEACGIEEFSGRQFDYVFAMESIYYAPSPLAAVKGARAAMRYGGRFFCGTDYYRENKATAAWASEMPVDMHMLSEAQWISLFEDAGFAASARHSKAGSGKAWRRTHGTLFVTGVKKRPRGSGARQKR